LPEKQSEITFLVRCSQSNAHCNGVQKSDDDDQSFTTITKVVDIEHLAIKSVFIVKDKDNNDSYACTGRLVMFCRGKPKDTILAGATSFLLAFCYEDNEVNSTEVTFQLKGHSVHLLNSTMNPVFNTQPVIVRHQNSEIIQEDESFTAWQIRFIQ